MSKVSPLCHVPIIPLWSCAGMFYKYCPPFLAYVAPETMVISGSRLPQMVSVGSMSGSMILLQIWPLLMSVPIFPPCWCLWSVLHPEKLISWAVLLPRTMLTWVVCSATEDHAKVSSTCWGSCGCPWSKLSPETTWKSMIHDPADCKGQGSSLGHGIADYTLTVEKGT